MEKTLNPGVAPAHARRGREVQLLPRPSARGEGQSGGAEDRQSIPRITFRRAWKPARRARFTFGDLADRDSAVAQSARSPQSFRLLRKLGTDPKVYYRSNRPWVRAAGRRAAPDAQEVNVAATQSAIDRAGSPAEWSAAPLPQFAAAG